MKKETKKEKFNRIKVLSLDLKSDFRVYRSVLKNCDNLSEFKAEVLWSLDKWSYIKESDANGHFEFCPIALKTYVFLHGERVYYEARHIKGMINKYHSLAKEVGYSLIKRIGGYDIISI